MIVSYHSLEHLNKAAKEINRREEKLNSSRNGRMVRFRYDWEDYAKSTDTVELYVCIATHLFSNDQEDKLANSIADRFNRFF